ncbi:MAG: ferrous iron transporter B [Clostridia bacterium]|nr:ferrous iron transporter B [Clostridia bacterium]
MKKKILILSKTPFASLSFHDRIDRLICYPAIGIPLFVLTVFLIFFLAFYGPGEYLAVLLEKLFIQTAEIFRTFLFRINTAEWLIRLLTDGIFLGVTSVICFLPQTAILFFLLTVLTESGYMARAIFVMDTVMRSLGLSGKAISSFLIAFGCTVPAITKTKEMKADEKETVIRSLLFIPCSARLPVLLFLVSECFETYPALAAACFYILCFFTAFLSATLDSKKRKNEDTEPLILSLPDYKIPRLHILLRETAEKSADFLIRACTIIFLCSAVLNLLGMLTPSFVLTEIPDESILFHIGNLFSPIFQLLGFGNGAVAIALLSGFFAKESIVAALALLLPTGITSVLSPAGAISFCAFSMLYTPCMSSLHAIAKELGRKKALRILLRTILFAFLISFALYTFTYVCTNCC